MTKATRDYMAAALYQLSRQARSTAGDLRGARRSRAAEGYDEAASFLFATAEWMTATGEPPLVQQKLWD